MIIKSRYFGEIDVKNDQIISFEEGLPGFEDKRQFVIVENAKDKDTLFIWLQSVDDENVAFALMDVFRVFEEYSPEINDNDIALLGDGNKDDYLVYNIVVIPDKVEDMTVNLLAPVVINLNTKKGKQVILNNNAYSVSHKVFDKIERYPKETQEV